MVCREAISDQARLNRLNLTTYRILDIRNTSNRNIIGTAISFLSDIHFRNICYWINQYPYQYLVFIVIRFLFLQDNGYASRAIIISTSPSTSLKPDESRGVSSHIWIPTFELLATRYHDLILTLCGSINTKKKVMDKLTSSSGNIERMIPVWQFFQSEWRTQFLSTL